MSRGRLKIFLGMAAGVGKTYAMLEIAGKKMEEGVGVVAGVVDTHGRIETAKLLEPLKKIPEKEIAYKGKVFKELDVDAVLHEHPELVLVDELAHTNIPGSRHEKRWQDVEEIIDAGIHVYTTLNIQHVESLKELIEEVAKTPVRETIPDIILEKAHHIELVDLTPEELLQRLKEGKVYTADMSEIARRNFFQEDRLTALREIALRYAADIVDVELQQMISLTLKGKGWKPRDRLLVAFDHTPFSKRLLRRTRRFAFSLHAPWIAVYIDDGKELNEKESNILAKNIELAKALGAEVITRKDPDIALTVKRISEEKKITQIVIGKTERKGLFQPSLLDQLLKITKGIDIHLVRPLKDV